MDRKRLIPYYLDTQAKYAVFDNEDKKWVDKHRAQVLKNIRSTKFFSWFDLKEQRQIMNEMEVKLYQKDHVVFFDKDKVCVVVSGSILMKNHERNILLPQTFAKYGEGDILNF